MIYVSVFFIWFFTLIISIYTMIFICLFLTITMSIYLSSGLFHLEIYTVYNCYSFILFRYCNEIMNHETLKSFRFFFLREMLQYRSEAVELEQKSEYLEYSKRMQIIDFWAWNIHFFLLIHRGDEFFFSLLTSSFQIVNLWIELYLKKKLVPKVWVCLLPYSATHCLSKVIKDVHEHVNDKNYKKNRQLEMFHIFFLSFKIIYEAFRCAGNISDLQRKKRAWKIVSFVINKSRHFSRQTISLCAWPCNNLYFFFCCCCY